MVDQVEVLEQIPATAELVDQVVAELLEALAVDQASDELPEVLAVDQAADELLHDGLGRL